MIETGIEAVIDKMEAVTYIKDIAVYMKSYC